MKGEAPARVTLMSSTLTAMDLWPLVQKLPLDEQVRLAKLALGEAAAEAHPDAAAYRQTPPDVEEFSAEADPLGWEGEGWEEFYAAR
jgi:hypothetical protein